MSLAATVGQSDVIAWITLAVVVFGPGAVAATLTAPFLAARRVRALFRTLPPTESVAASYVLATFLGSVPYLVGTIVVLGVANGGPPARSAERLLLLVSVVSVTVVVGWSTICGLVLPEVGYDWDPTGYGPGTWVLLIGGSAWYAATLAVPIALFALVISLPV